jgi:hypothetical protein
MAVYLIQLGENGPVKIGRGNSPEQRLRELQTSSPIELRLLGTRPGGARAEAELHKQFSANRIRGEWFRFNDEMIPAFFACNLADETSRVATQRKEIIERMRLREAKREERKKKQKEASRKAAEKRSKFLARRESWLSQDVKIRIKIIEDQRLLATLRHYRRPKHETDG